MQESREKARFLSANDELAHESKIQEIIGARELRESSLSIGEHKYEGRGRL